jgi:hypothetical protein
MAMKRFYGSFQLPAAGFRLLLGAKEEDAACFQGAALSAGEVRPGRNAAEQDEKVGEGKKEGAERKKAAETEKGAEQVFLSRVGADVSTL